MKIAQIVCAFPPYKGGMGNVAQVYAKLLSQAGHEVDVLTPNYQDLPLEQSNKLFRVRRLKPFAKLGNGAFLPQLFKLSKNYDILFLHYPFYGGVEPVCASKLLGNSAKLIIHYHMDTLGLSWQAKLLSTPSALFKNYLFKNADAVTCASLDYVSHSSISSIYEKQREKFHEIPFGVDTDKFRPAAGNEGNDLRPFLFVGGLDKAHYFKGVEALLKAFKKSKQKLSLNIVGEGDMKHVYQKQAKDLGLEKRVKFLGKVSDSELVRQYQDAEATVLPSTAKNEAFGLVLLESMACGTPVIASSLPGVRKVFNDNYEGFLVAPGDIDELSVALNKFSKQPGLRQEMSVRALELVRRKYNWENTKTELTRIIASL